MHGLRTAERWEDATRAYQRVLNDVLFDNPPRLMLLVPAASGFRMMSIPYRAEPEAATLGRSVRPAMSARVALADARWPLALLGGYLVALISLAFLVFPKARY